MKPIKNRFFCIACSRPKMLFSTKSKADNFIRFNSEAIYEETGIAPVRSYYCPMCLGWHTTHIASECVGDKFNHRDNERMTMLIYYFKKKKLKVG